MWTKEEPMKKRTFILTIAVFAIVVAMFTGCATTQAVEPIAPVQEPAAPAAVAPAQVAEPVAAPVTEPVVASPPAVVEPVAAAVKPTAPATPVEPAGVPATTTKVLKLIATSDMHGNLFPYDFIRNSTAATSQMHVASFVEEQRAKDQSVVLLDNGDVLQGQPIVYYYNFVKTKAPHIVPAVMNDMGYDAASVGNHDVEAGPEVYLRAAAQANYPYLAANAVFIDSGEPAVPPYTIIERDGLRIAVLGLITPYIPKWLPQNLYEGVRFDDMVETAAKWIPIIEEKENPDLIVGLFHAGVDETYSGSADQKGNENASKLVAQRVEGFDVIFTGHDHQDTDMVVQSPSGKEVVIVGAMNGARSVAVATVGFSLDAASGSYVVESVDGETVAMDTYAPHAGLMAKYQPVVDEVTAWVSRQVGTISETISSRDSMFGDSKFVDLIHQIQLEKTGAELSISAPLSLDATIKQGPVYVRDMFSLYPYENLLFTMEMTGREIKAFLEYSYEKWFNQMKSLDDDLINFKRDAEGNLVFNTRYNTYDTATRYYNYDSFAGINYVVDITKPAGQRVNIKTMANGSAFQLDRTYVVAINSYRAQGGGGHLAAAGITSEMALDRILYSTDKDLRFYLMEAFETKGEIVPTVDNNWLVIPNLWVQRGMKNSYPKLYTTP
jgi:2',3'-cyclic-nucleotide 2'-phosphodiesterase/3'-nucleotidase